MSIIPIQNLMQQWDRMATESNADRKREFCKQYVKHAIEKLHVRDHRLHILPVQGTGPRHQTMLSLPYVHRRCKGGKSCTVLSKVSFQFQVREVCDVRRSWARLQQNHLGTDETKYYFQLPLLLEGTPNCKEPHLKRQDRFRVVAFCLPMESVPQFSGSGCGRRACCKHRIWRKHASDGCMSSPCLHNLSILESKEKSHRPTRPGTCAGNKKCTYSPEKR